MPGAKEFIVHVIPHGNGKYFLKGCGHLDECLLDMIIFSFDKAKNLRFFARENLFRLIKTFLWTTLSVLLFFALFAKRF